jgi:replicative DNA helicase
MQDLFYYPENKFIYRVSVWMWKKGHAIDILTVTNFIYQKGIEKWEKISNDNLPYYITGLTNAVSSSANIETHCLLLREMYIKRLLYEAKYSDEFSIDAALETKKKIEEAFNIASVDNWFNVEETINKKLAKRMENSGAYNIVETSFRKLNDRSPVEIGDYIILGARPSMGKTALAMQMACDIALTGNSVGIVSLETKSEKLAARMLSGNTGIEFWKIWKNRLSENETERFYTKASELSQLPIFIYDKPTIDHTGIRIAATNLRRKTKGNLIIFIDYIQLIAPEENTRLDRRLQINEISRTIKLLCMELENTTVIALAQLTRDAGKEPPRMHHLKESGALEQDADKIWLLHRDRDKEETQGGEFDASLFIEKNKEGWTGSIDLTFEAEQMTFKEKGSEIKLPVIVGDVVNYYEKEIDDTPF